MLENVALRVPLPDVVDQFVQANRYDIHTSTVG
jgi:hypothetical protein